MELVKSPEDNLEDNLEDDQSEFSDSGYDFDIEFTLSESEDEQEEPDIKIDKSIIPHGKMEINIDLPSYIESAKEVDFMAAMLQMEEDEKLAKELFQQEQHINVRKIGLTTYIGNTKLTNNPCTNLPVIKTLKEIRYCQGLTIKGSKYKACTQRVKPNTKFCCLTHKTNFINETNKQRKIIILRVLIYWIPDKNIRKCIYKMLYDGLMSSDHILDSDRTFNW